MSSMLTEVRKLVESLPLRVDAPLADDDPLISSGLLDSMALFRLYQGIEQKAGRQLNPLELDFESQWDTIAAIARFIEDMRGSR